MSAFKIRSLLLAALLLCFTAAACKKPQEGPSVRASGRVPAGEIHANGPSGEAKAAAIRTDDDGRRFQDLEFLSDGVTIRGELALPARKDPAPAVVLVHMLGSDHTAWSDIQLLFADEGIATFAIDLRGHGTSEGGPEGYGHFSPQEWQAGLSDVRNAVEALKEFPELINPARIAVMGASIGANYALEMGAEDASLPIIALSPGADYHGVQAEEPVKTLKRRAFLAGETEDPPANDFLEWAMDAVPEALVWKEDGAAHGTDMFPDGPLENQILLFLRDRWGVQPTEPGGVMPEGLSDAPLLDDLATTDEPPAADEEPADSETGDDPDIAPPTEDDFKDLEG